MTISLLLAKKKKSMKTIFILKFNVITIGEKLFEKFLLNLSKQLDLPIIATHEVFYLDKDMYEAHDAYLCIGEKTYVNVKDRRKYSNQHYLKKSEEMYDLFK